MKRWIVWGLVAAVAGGAVAVGFTVEPVRRFADRVVSAFGLSRVREELTYWCPMHPEIRRNRPGACPV